MIDHHAEVRMAGEEAPEIRERAFGVCEVFSLSPTKVVTALEGGLVTTNEEGVADRLRQLRDYGKDARGGEDMTGLGLSARMSEVHAAVGLLSLRRIRDLVKARQDRITLYRERLGRIPGCRLQTLLPDRTSSGNYFVLFIGPDARRSRDEVHAALKDRGVQTKRYFYPPLHEQAVFRGTPARSSARLSVSTTASREGLALPLYSHMTDEQWETVCHAVEALLT